MKRIILLGLTTLSILTTQAQVVPTISTPPNGGQTNGDYWSRAGNTTTGNNIFGTMWNSPIYTVTGNTFSSGNNYRTKLNGIFSGPNQYNINGFGWNQGINTTGYMLLGNNLNNFYTNMGAFSLLHLNTQSTGSIQEFGFRPWMKTGITLTGNSDLSYMGLRQLGTGEDVTETTIAWSDNAGSISGPDELTFRYTEGSGSTYNTNFANADDMDGRHIARFTGEGAMGLGNTFGINIGSSVNYARPMSLLHQSFQFVAGNGAEGNGFHQITYRRANGASSDIVGQGEAATDGLRFGIDNDVFNTGGVSYLNSYLRWQEASSFIVQTEDDATPNIQSNERLRVTSIGALSTNYNTILYDGLTASSNATRISISESGAAPLLRPKSLLHLGYDYGGLFNIQGYRKWMDLGMLTSNQRDHVWIGLKPRDSIVSTVSQTNDKLDAVVAWGTDREATSPTQVDNMRFIFTGHVFDVNPEGAPSTSYNGLEMMRMYPATVYTHPIYDASGTLIGNEKSYGRVGIGDFTASGVSGEPTQKLDVVGNARLRYLPDPAFARDSTVDKFVMVDSTGVLRWGYAPKGLSCWDLNGNGIPESNEDINNDGQWDALDCQGDDGPMGSFGAHNGTSLSTIDTTKVSLGQDLNQVGSPGRLLSNREIPMNNFNTIFTNAPGYDGNANRLGLGTSAPSAKLDITMTPTTPYSVPIALNISMNQAASNGQIIGQRMELFGNNTVNSGAKWSVQAGQTQSEGHLVMVHGNSTSNSSHQGIVGTCDVGGLPILNVGVAGAARGGKSTYGGNFNATGVAGSNITAGVHIHAQGTGNNKVYGLHAQIGGSGTGTAYGVFSDVLSTTANYTIGVYSNIYGNTNNPINRAGYFTGPVEATSFITTPSDQQFKTNVNPLVGSLKSIQGLKPVSYYMDNVNYSQFGFDSNLQFGFIAQEVETVFPNLVHESLHPAQYDSLGVETFPAVPYKSLNYNAMIPVNTMAIIELNEKVDRATLSDQTMKTNVQDLTGSLDKVLDMRGVSYDWNHAVNPEMNLDSLNHVGFIAQEIAQIDPRLTYLADDSLLHVEYDKVVPILAEAIQEMNDSIEVRDSIFNILITENSTQQTIINTLSAENASQQSTIDDLNNRLTQLENCLSGILPYLCQLSHSAIQANTPETQEEVRKNLNVTLSNRNAIVLDQNVPNPFAEQTIINFSIPETVKKAQIHFYDGNGRFMNSVDVIERGLGSVTVFGSDLSTGVYTYTLVADGQVVATKKMMKQ
ncbi:tail fiber domain-containing protein [Fluviicola chungangensis]|uniref:T9SS type A sorting domain-containing protein n=1 Tax=Fluviicola chungangensis TaxID=2597671 RepID=A0A556N3U5_9FLAO|nr:tail fiber domain-containing protein [Fluviicola chungangensis]TSJ46729.1 T9SS type A sorting domain-containing protein [Fluviicola chungangensis]